MASFVFFAYVRKGEQPKGRHSDQSFSTVAVILALIVGLVFICGYSFGYNGKGHLAELIVIDNARATPAVKECWKQRLQALKKDLGYNDAPLLEKLLI